MIPFAWLGLAWLGLAWQSEADAESEICLVMDSGLVSAAVNGPIAVNQ